MGLELRFGDPDEALDPEVTLARMRGFREAFDVLSGGRPSTSNPVALGLLRQVRQRGLDDDARRRYETACDEAIAALERRLLL